MLERSYERFSCFYESHFMRSLTESTSKNIAADFSLRRKMRPLALFTYVATTLLILPILVIVSAVFTGSYDFWKHLANTVLWDYLFNSFALVIGVGIVVLILGVPAAWLVSSCEFPGRKFFTWALLLPLAMPAYIIAYTYTGLLDFAGPVQTLLRDITGWEYGDYWFFNIRSLTGAIIMLSLVLYPYMYLLARAAFQEQSSSLLEAGRTLGYNQRKTFFKLSLPIARPAIMAGLTLALMETLADYGTVQYFGVSTFTTGIFRTFYGFGDTAAAAQLSAILFIFVLLLIALERHSRKQSRYYSSKGKSLTRIPLNSRKALLAFCICLFPLLFGFVVPAFQLAWWSFTEARIDQSFLLLAWHSFYLACIAAFVAVSLGLLMAYSKRLYSQNNLITSSVSIAGMGYALPGTIIAIGIIIPLAWMDHQLIALAEKWLNINLGLILSGTLVALIFAYTVRFLAVSMGSIESGLQKIKPNVDHAARTMGYSSLQVLRKIHIPLLSSSVLTAFLIVFVDVLKELPATLILRPFNFNTLAVRAYELASDERLIDAAPSSLIIVLVGLLPVILLSRSITLRSKVN
jgi:iron(III) transport system permease protein